MTGPPGPPPPPPPPPPPAPETGDVGAAADDMASALFAEINSLGEGARSGLKKAVRGPVAGDDCCKPDASSTAATPATTKPAPKKSTFSGTAVCELTGKKWAIEYQSNRDDIVIEVASMKHTVYVYRCEKSTIQVKGKANSISIDGCKKVDLVFEDALSQVEILNSDSIRVQCTGNAPSINIDGCNSVTYFMSQASVESAMVITSKSAAINLVRPKPDDPDDIIETPIPEQFCTTFKDGEFETKAVEHDD